MPQVRKIYVALLDEGVSVWRPVDAEILNSDTYRIIGNVPDGEVWQFQPGDIVGCQMQVLSGEMELVASRKIG